MDWLCKNVLKSFLGEAQYDLFFRSIDQGDTNDFVEISIKINCGIGDVWDMERDNVINAVQRDSCQIFKIWVKSNQEPAIIILFNVVGVDGPMEFLVLKVPVINAAISIVAHVIVLILLMLIFRLNIHAVVLANTFFALLMCFMNSMALKKYSGFNQEIKRTFIIPAISSLIMGVISYIVYFILYKACHIEIIAFILAAIIAVISYAVALLLLKGLTEDELRHFPKGTLIIKVAKKCHLL